MISQGIKPIPNEKVMRWLSGIPREETFLSVVSIQELRTGVELLAAGRKRRDLESWLVNDVQRRYAGRFLPITEEIADVCGRLFADRRKMKSGAGLNDVLLAATALVHGMTVATLNTRHFEKLGVKLVEF